VKVDTAISDKATGISTERYDHGSAVVRCGMVVESRAVRAMVYRDMIILWICVFLGGSLERWCCD